MLGRSLFLWGPQLPHVSGKRQMRPLLTAPHYILYRIPGVPHLPHSAPKGLHGGSAGHWTRNRGLSTSTPPPSLLVCSGSPGEFSRNLCWTRYVSYRHESRSKNRNINECSGVRQRSKRENGEQWRERAARVRGRRGAALDVRKPRCYGNRWPELRTQRTRRAQKRSKGLARDERDWGEGAEGAFGLPFPGARTTFITAPAAVYHLK